MPYLYILYSSRLDRYYIGSTLDIENRLKEHNRGKTVSTRAGMPWEVVFHHQAESLKKARRLEYRLKSWKDRKILEKIILDQEIRMRDEGEPVFTG